MNRFDRLVRDLTAILYLVAVPRLTTTSPSPQPGEQQAEELQRIVDAINTGLQGLVFVLGNATAVAVHAVLVAAAPMALLWLAIRLGGPRIHQAMQQTRLASVQIIPPAEGVYEPARWVAAFRMLYAIALPWWKRAIIGQPWITFELEAREGQLVARCTFLKDLDTLVTSALRKATPGADIVPVHIPPRGKDDHAAQVPLALWREAIYPLGSSSTDALASAAQSLAEAGDGIIQVAIAPDTGGKHEPVGASINSAVTATKPWSRN